MTILNRTSDGLFNILIALFRALLKFGPMKKERLITLCSPGSDNDLNMLKKTVSTWAKIGLFEINGDEIKFSEDIYNWVGKLTIRDLDDPILLRRIFRHLLFKRENNDFFWDKEKTKAADFTRAISFLLAQDIYELDMQNHSTIGKLERVQLLENKCMLQNDTRWAGVLAWGRYLGFIWEGEVRMMDPTIALCDELPFIFNDKKTLLAADFVNKTSEAIPVLDGGRYRKEVESALNSTYWTSAPQEGRLSTSLSRAIWRLQQSNTIRLENRSDTGDRRSLQRSKGKEWNAFTHVSIVLGEN